MSVNARLGGMKTATILLALWLVVFTILTLALNEGGELALSGGEWCHVFGLPWWLGVEGEGGYNGFWGSVGRGTWGFSPGRLIAALLVAATPMPLAYAGCLMLRDIRKRRQAARPADGVAPTPGEGDGRETE